VAVATDPRKAGVDDVMDAGNGQGGLGDIRRQHHAPSAVRLEDPRLLMRPLASVERQDLGGGRMMLAQGLGGLADLALAREKDQHVAASDARQLADRIRDRLLDRLVALADRLVLGRSVAHLDRIGPSRDLEDGRRAALRIGEVHGEALRIDGRGGDDELQIRSARQQTLQIAEQHVDVEAALVRLVDDEGVVFVEQPILLDLREQDAVGHQLDRGLRADPVVEAHLVADQPAGCPAELLRNPIRQGACRDAPRLGVADPPGEPASEFQTELRQLSRLAGARLAAKDDDLMRRDRLRDLLAALAHGKLGRIGDDRRHAGTTAFEEGLGFSQGLPNGKQTTLERLARTRATAQAAQTLAQPVAVLNQTGAEVGVGGKREVGQGCLNRVQRAWRVMAEMAEPPDGRRSPARCAERCRLCIACLGDDIDSLRPNRIPRHSVGAVVIRPLRRARGDQLSPVIRWITTIQHGAKDGVWSPLAPCRAKAVVVVDPSKDDDPGLGVEAKEQA